MIDFSPRLYLLYKWIKSLQIICLQNISMGSILIENKINKCWNLKIFAKR